MSENRMKHSFVPRRREFYGGAIALLVLGGVLMSRGGKPTATLADAPKLNEKPVQRENRTKWNSQSKLDAAAVSNATKPDSPEVLHDPAAEHASQTQ